MPIYEFFCQDCQRQSEVLLRSTNWTGAKCPHCGSLKLTKNLSVFATASAGREGCPEASACPASAAGYCSGSSQPHLH
jgi:putative FmdB family regulatory protein